MTACYGISGTVNSGYSTKIEFKSRNQFPSRGHPRYLYIATDENRMYRWDNEYIPISGGGTGTGTSIDDNVTSQFSTWSSKKISDALKCASLDDITCLF